jgi:hypothetical protein
MNEKGDESVQDKIGLVANSINEETPAGYRACPRRLALFASILISLAIWALVFYIAFQSW